MLAFVMVLLHTNQCGGFELFFFFTLYFPLLASKIQLLIVRCFGFFFFLFHFYRVVEFASYSDLKNAIEKLSGKEINGRKIKLIEGSKRHRYGYLLINDRLWIEKALKSAARQTARLL